jgi:hypothetical protein
MRHLVMLLLAASAFGCQAPEPPPSPPQIVTFNFRVHSDPGKPVDNADLFFNGKKVATTDAAGLGRLNLSGKDGESFEITVVCPQGYFSPERPIPVVLKRLADPSRTPEYAATCPPRTRTFVVAVRADNGPNLPITYLGREIARTDDSGAAHVMLKLKPGEQFDLTLNTSSKHSEGLRPQNPTMSFTVGQRDEVATFNQKFEQEGKRVVVRKRRPRAPAKTSQ